MHDHHSHDHTHTIDMPTSIEGLPEARRPEVVELSDGDEFELEIVAVKKQIGEATVRMLAYNGSVPGPTLKVPAGLDDHSARHKSRRHGRDCSLARDSLENRFDGTHETQAPIPVGETFTYEVTFPDPGAYWYHPISGRTTARSSASTGTCSLSRARLTTGRPSTASSS